MTTESRTANLPAPQDLPYPGTLKLHVDCSDTRQGIFRVHEIIPVAVGELILLYPQWLPGHHSPTGPIDRVAGLTVTANGKALKWQRETYDVYAFRITVPKGVKAIDVDFQYLSARSSAQGPTEMTDVLLDLVWDKCSLYPAGHYTRQITIEASVTLPKGWDYGTALRAKSHKGNAVTFRSVAYNTLVDSPIYAGLYAKKIDLDPGAKVPVTLNVFADAPRFLDISKEQTRLHRNLVKQAYRLFKSRHYAHYDFLLSVSDHLSGKGLEHHQSSEDGHPANYFTDWVNGAPRRDLLAHEYEHSWNGKFRRPAANWTPNFNVPMGDGLLWVYEGQTQYWGYVLTARSGLWSAEQYRDALAQVAAVYDRGRPGFAWRGIDDTTNDPTAALRRPQPYYNWQMREEYYNAGQLLWLWVDAKLRELTGGKKSLDHFARAFFGIDDGQRETETYVFNDVIQALNGVAKYNWAPFLKQHVSAHKPPLQGIKAAGWQLVYTDTPSDYEKQIAKRDERQPGFMYSIGVGLGKGGYISDVRWNGPAYKAGVSSGETLLAVNGTAYKPEHLADSIRRSSTDTAPIELLLKYQDHYRTVTLHYHDGPQYPHLAPIKGATDYLSDIIDAK
ncbi:MAG TPA: hypothetical protein VFQ88_02640 [Nevskiaceae bacterium]|nr:hypothetical protein [Nevskiaceae bacterium]